MEHIGELNTFIGTKTGYEIKVEIIFDELDFILRIICKDIKFKDSWSIDLDNNKILDITDKTIENIINFKIDVLEDALSIENKYKMKISQIQKNLIIKIENKILKEKLFHITLEKVPTLEVEILKSLIKNLRLELFEIKSSKKHILKVQSNLNVNYGEFFNWNVSLLISNTHFKHDGGSNIIILKDGLYQINIRYVAQYNGKIDLYVKENVVARVFHETSFKYNSNSLVEILHLKENDIIMVKYLSSKQNYTTDQLCNYMTILLIE